MSPRILYPAANPFMIARLIGEVLPAGLYAALFIIIVHMFWAVKSWIGRSAKVQAPRDTSQSVEQLNGGKYLQIIKQNKYASS